MKRYRLDGTTIEANVLKSKCYECGMPTLAPDEFHPYEACVEFKKSHDSGTVEPLLRRLMTASLEEV